MAEQSSTTSCLCGRPATKGRYCDFCLRAELEGTDLQELLAAARILRDLKTPVEGDNPPWGGPA